MKLRPPGQFTIGVRTEPEALEDEELRVRIVLDFVCERCGLAIEKIETTKWRLLNVGDFLLAHYLNACEQTKAP